MIASPSRVLIAALRRLGFAWSHALLVALYTRWLCDALPPLRGEDPWLVVIPATGIAALVLSAAHGAIVAAPSHAARLAWLGGSVCVAVAMYTTYAVVTMHDAPNPIGLALLVMMAQFLYGLPLFLAVAVMAKLTSPWLVGRRVTAWS